jgi:hypothetical protein
MAKGAGGNAGSRSSFRAPRAREPWLVFATRLKNQRPVLPIHGGWTPSHLISSLEANCGNSWPAASYKKIANQLDNSSFFVL